MLEIVPDQYKTQEMCIKAAEESPRFLAYIRDRFKTQVMCIKAVEAGPWQLRYVPDHFKITLRHKKCVIKQ